MASSYDKINHSFLKTAEWKDQVARFREEIKKAGIARWEFHRSRNYQTGMDEVSTTFILSFAGKELSRSAEAFSQFTFPSGDAMEDDWLMRTLDLNWATRACPTYFCKKEKAQKKWPEFARKQLVDGNMDVVGEYEKRVRSQFQQMSSSPELAAERARFYERGVIDEIRKVVLKYYGKVTPEVLKEALDEVVAHAIMES